MKFNLVMYLDTTDLYTCTCASTVCLCVAISIQGLTLLPHFQVVNCHYGYVNIVPKWCCITYVYVFNSANTCGI